jgi:hypothetical protein
MLELLFAILEMFFEIFFEAAFEFAAEYLGALIWRLLDGVLDTSEFKSPVLATLAYLLLGGVAGGLSLLLLPHPLVHRSRVPGISVFLSPLLAGLGMSLVGSTLRQRNKKPLQIESFGYGFAFAFGMALVRFLLAK